MPPNIFFLKPGERQGCSLLLTLFVIAIGFLPQSIRRCDNIKGIEFQANQEVKLTQYPDNTTPLLANEQSVSSLAQKRPLRGRDN